jgi:hypothetical protein
MRSDQHRSIFSKIYEEGFWSSPGIPSSGSGSIPSAATVYVDLVMDFLKKEEIKTVLDIGHGDWSMWEKYKFSDVDYLGVDVYEKVTENLNTLYETKNRKFKSLNVVTEKIPTREVCISKDVLQHLPTKDIIQVLNKIDKFHYLIICNDFYKINAKDLTKSLRRYLSLRERFTALRNKQSPFFLKLKRTNSDCQIGEHRPLDLQKRPFEIHLSKFDLIQFVDFNGSLKKRPNIVKRIYVYRNREILSYE